MKHDENFRSIYGHGPNQRKNTRNRLSLNAQKATVLPQEGKQMRSICETNPKVVGNASLCSIVCRYAPYQSHLRNQRKSSLSTAFFFGMMFAARMMRGFAAFMANITSLRAERTTSF
jgi:Na+(H+)/acetate symporter ActP